MRSIRLPAGILLASLAVSVAVARDDGGEVEIIEHVDSKTVSVTYPKADAAIAKGTRLVVMGTVEVPDGEKAPELVIVKFTGAEKLELGSWALRLGDEEADHGLYRLKEGVYSFRFRVKAPRTAGKCDLTVESIGMRTVGKSDEIVKERCKPLAIEIR